MAVTETMHVNRIQADARTFVALTTGTDGAAGVFFAVTPFVDCDKLPAHGGCVSAVGGGSGNDEDSNRLQDDLDGVDPGWTQLLWKVVGKSEGEPCQSVNMLFSN